MRKDGLISYATWLVKLQDPNSQKTEPSPDFALLLDYQHPSAGKRPTGIGFGNYLLGELCFYPSRMPLRGFFLQQETVSTLMDDAFNSDVDNQTTNKQHSPSKNDALQAIEPLIYPTTDLALIESLSKAYQQWLAKLPWLDVMPYALPKGRVVKVDKNEYWFAVVDDKGEPCEWLRLSNDAISDVVLGSALATGFVLWNGLQGQLLSVVSEQWGLLSCQN